MKMGTKNTQQLTIRLRCIDLPSPDTAGKHAIRLGIQKGKVVIDDRVVDVQEIDFTCVLRVEKNEASGKPNFLGPYAHGTPAERFLYLCWGERIEGQWHGFGRAKIHLKELAWHPVERAISTGEPIEATIRLSDKTGGPLYASLKGEQITWAIETHSQP